MMKKLFLGFLVAIALGRVAVKKMNRKELLF